MYILGTHAGQPTIKYTFFRLWVDVVIDPYEMCIYLNKS